MQDSPTLSSMRPAGRDGRPCAAQRGYGRRWQRARRQYLAAHSTCETCARVGLICTATVVDHIIPHRGDSRLFWHRGNWQALCKPCHDRKTAMEDGGFGKMPQGHEKAGSMAEAVT